MDPIKIAYLTNVYPAVSHSFIRREIAALEEQGLKISRWSVRRPSGSLPDPADQAEAGKTLYLLDRPLAVVFATLAALVTSPLVSVKALRAALAERRSGIRSLIKRLAHFAEACFLARALRAEGVAHLHVHFGTNPAAVARLSHIMGGPRYSFTVHGPDEFDSPSEIGLGGKVSDAAFVAGISDFGKSQLMRWSPVNVWERIHVVRCGVDDSYLNHHIPNNEDLSADTFCCVGRLAPQKGMPLLVEAFAHPLLANRKCRLVLVGDGPLRPELEAMIARLGVSDRIILAGLADGAQVRQHLLGSRAMVLPSFAEGLPVVIMEALALGRPVISTAVAGISELVDAGCGWLIPAGSVEALAQAITSALDASDEDIRTLGSEGRRRVVERHDARGNARTLKALFDQAATDDKAAC